MEVGLRKRDGALELRVSDDGRGICDAATRAGRGIAGMRERALYTGATLEFGHAEGRGTDVRLRVPLP